MPGKIILLNGASSAGKSSMARVVQARASVPFWHYSIDHLKAGGVLPTERIDAGDFAWSTMREAFFEGFHRSILAFAEAGNNIIVEHIIEQRAWMDRLLLLLASHDIFFVGLHCPLDELERREVQRGDRRIGEARADHAIAHTFGEYDLELETTRPAAEQAAELLAAWEARPQPSAFKRMARRRGAASAANPLLERTSTGRARWTQGGQCHHPPCGQPALPAGAARLERQAAKEEQHDASVLDLV